MTPNERIWHSRSDLACAEVREMGVQLADGVVPAVVRHLADCGACRVYMAERTCD